MSRSIPMLGISAYSGTGKTTLLKQVIPLLKEKGLRITVIKHAHHNFELDIPGKDSYELRKSGADQTIICTKNQLAQITDFDQQQAEPSLEDIVASLDPERVDLVLVEGYKNSKFSKIELNRQARAKPYRYPDDPLIIALACDHAPPPDCTIKVLDINDYAGVADFIYQDFYQLLVADRKRGSQGSLAR
jgi:molybdopterin-guanine dinucleotide biosynthesis protein MobB